jgi:capsule polysaccharide export protein KpsE/RkpR
MIGSESKSYYDIDGKSCNFIIRDIRGYVLTLMWIIITIFSLIITVRYIHKILHEVSSKRRHNQPLLSLAILGQPHGQSIASKDILMQQIEQRIKLNILLIILFIIFWFPLFIVTLCDIKFKINEFILR